MLLSNCDILLPLSKPEPRIERNALGAEEALIRSPPSRSLVLPKLKLSTNVTEPLVVELDDSPFGAFASENFQRMWIKYLVVLPKKGSRLLRDCILVTPRNWERAGLPSYWTSTGSTFLRPIGQAGAKNLVRGCLSCQSSHPWGWCAASSYVDRKYKYTMSRVLRRTRIDFWRATGWAGIEPLIQVQPFWSKTPFQRLKYLVISKWCAFTGVMSH